MMITVDSMHQDHDTNGSIFKENIKISAAAFSHTTYPQQCKGVDKKSYGSSGGMEEAKCNTVISTG